MFQHNIFNYLKKYGNKTFNEEKFNEIDNIVFSLLTYLNYSDIDVNGNTIEVVGKTYLEKHSYKEISKYGLSIKDAYKVLEQIIKLKRYKDIIMEDYININNNMQFSAVTFKITNKLIYISFEGTDQYISSWRESFNMLASFIVLSHNEAIKYINKHIKLFGPKVIVGGHSKGGNLALYASLYLKKYKLFKIKKIYNNDGPGLRKKEFKSLKYKLIKNKYVHIIPQNSVVGILLRSDKYRVIKSKRVSFFSHSMTTWCIKDKEFITSTLSNKHKKLEKRIINWVDTHTDLERKKTIDTIFDVIEKNEIDDTMTLMKLSSIIKIIKDLNQVDEEAKKLTIEFLKSIFVNKKTN